jgi:broad specificity phosphatase PhoE
LTRLVLVRHGEAQSYVDGVIGGPTGCTGLSDLGRRQADALRARLERTGELDDVAALYTSTLPRAVETAERILPAMEGTARCELCELHVDGQLDGRPFKEFEDDYDGQPVPAVGGGGRAVGRVRAAGRPGARPAHDGA